MGKRFAGKAAIVTGSSSGIGKATALQMAREGAAVCVVADRNVAGGEGTANEIQSAGGNAIFVQADVSSGADCRRVVAAAVSAFVLGHRARHQPQERLHDEPVCGG